MKWEIIMIKYYFSNELFVKFSEGNLFVILSVVVVIYVEMCFVC